MASSFFNPKEYYYITTTKYSGYNLVSESDKTPAFLGEFNKTSSENWQLFFQNGIFFIRNYRWGANLQLGLTPDNKGSPQLYTRSGDLGQQWTLRQVGANFVMMNGLLGASANFSFPDGVGRPGMYSNTGGELWNITINESAGNTRPIKDGDEFLSPVTGVVTSSSSSISLQSTPTPSPSPSNTLPPSTSPTTLPPPPSPSPALSAGAIAGIVIGAIALISALAFLIWFLLARRRKARAAPAYGHAQQVHEAYAGPPSHPTEKYAHRSELQTPAAAVELASTEYPAELGGGNGGAYWGHERGQGQGQR